MTTTASRYQVATADIDGRPLITFEAGGVTVGYLHADVALELVTDAELLEALAREVGRLAIPYDLADPEPE